MVLISAICQGLLTGHADAAQNNGRQGSSSYENAIITEDVNWNGKIVVRGYLVVAPQATLRIQPGTVISFIRSNAMNQPSRLVVQGRLDCQGTGQRPVLFTSNTHGAASGEWGGIVLLSNEKRNRLTHFAIEGAETALELRFSAIHLHNGRITQSGIGISAADSRLTAENLHISGSSKGLELINSEAELRGVKLSRCHDGIAATRSSLSIASSAISASLQHGVTARDCRIRIRSCELFDNRVGSQFIEGEGQIFLTRFHDNHELALQLSAARIKVSNSVFINNRRDAVQVDDGMGLFYGNVFSGNQRFNMVNNGRDRVSAQLNWWGSNSESGVIAGLQHKAKEDQNGEIVFSPWLPKQPAAVPFSTP